MENILELQEVSKRFPGSDFALERLSFSLPYGAILGFVGENGAGKTTTIGCILNTVKKDSGTVKLFGREIYLAFNIILLLTVIFNTHYNQTLKEKFGYFVTVDR